MKKNQMKKSMALLLAAVMFVSSGCGANTAKKEDAPKDQIEVVEKQDAGKVTFTDDLGREVTVERPKRVACLISSFSDIWYQAGGVDQIVAATSATWKYLDLPLKEDVVDLGSTKELNMEQLIASEPDFVLASCGTDRNVELEKSFEQLGLNVAYFNVDNLEDYLRVLKICTDITGCVDNYKKNGTVELEKSFEQLGLNVAYFNVDNLEDYLRVLKICTDITGCVDNYKKNGTDVEKQVEEVRKRVDGSKPSVLYVRATGSSCKVKNSEESVLGEMLADLDCVNIADQDGSLLEQLSMEKIVELDPEYIFVVLQSAKPNEAETMLENTLLRNVGGFGLRQHCRSRRKFIRTAQYGEDCGVRSGVYLCCTAERETK